MENHENIRLPWQDWRIVKYLGGGTYGNVYEIERNISGIQERAAVKIISRPKDTNEIESYYDNGYDKASIVASYEKEIQNYVQEYKLMKELQGQSNIVSCDDFTVIPHTNGIGGDIFIRMELLTSLQQVLRERTLSTEEIIKLGKDISRALILCEKKHIIHRDIKPLNIMISPFGDYKLGDFGVSKVMDHQTYATTTGTPEYLAPEILHMEKYGHTADIYSLGITLYWLLNNRKMPFIDADQPLTPILKNEATERRYRGEKLPPPKYGSSQLKQIVLKACEYRPENRYSSARELYAALDALKNKNTTINHQRQENGTAFSQKKNMHKTLSIMENERGSNKIVSVQYPDGSEKSFHVRIPETIRTGQSIRLKGQGTSTADMQSGDLYLDIVVTENQGYAETSTTYGQDETASWGNTVGTVGNPGGKAQQKKARVFTSEEIKANADHWGDKFENVFGDLFGDVFGNTGDDVDSTIGINNAGRQGANRQNHTPKTPTNDIQSELRKIQTYHRNTTLFDKFVGILLGIPFIGAGGVVTSFGSVGLILGPIIIYLGYRFIRWFFHYDFNTWVKNTKKTLPHLDSLIKNNPEFARELYYKKGDDNDGKNCILNYINTLNPTVANEIKASKK